MYSCICIGEKREERSVNGKLQGGDCRVSWEMIQVEADYLGGIDFSREAEWGPF